MPAVRFLVALTQACEIKRSATTVAADGDLEMEEPELIAWDVPCLLVPLKVSDDMLVGAGPMEVYRYHLLVPIGTDIENHDVVTIDNDVEYAVTDPPVVWPFRGADHHIETIVEKMVQ